MEPPILARLRVPATALSLGLLLLVAAGSASAARPGLGPRGWAPGELPIHLSSAAVTAVLWAAYLLGGAAVALGLRHGARPVGWRWPLLLGALALLTAPIGSADHINYAAYGRIAAQGGDPYVVPPITWAGGHDPVTSAVEAPWTMTPSIYGPFATATQELSSVIGGDNLRQTVWVGQLLVVLAWLAVRWLLVASAPDDRTRSRVDLLWTLNPLVFGVGVLGAHVDVVAVALALAAIVLAARRPWLAGLLLGAAVSTKVTYAVVGLAILWSWRRLPRAALVRNTIGLAVASLGLFVLLDRWAGPHVFDQLARSRRSVSLATPWRPLVELLTGPLPGATVRNLVFAAAVVVIVALAALLGRVSAGSDGGFDGTSYGSSNGGTTGSALRATFALSTAYALAAPYSLPWYDLLTFATLPLLAAGLLGAVLDGVLVARLVVMALAYVPGRVVGMSAQVQAFTLGWRRHAAPYAGWLAWAVIAWLGWQAWSRRSDEVNPPAPSTPPAPPAPPTQPASQP